MVLEGSYKIEKEENSLEYFKAIGVPGKYAEQLIKNLTYITIESNGDEYTITLAEEKDKPQETRKYVNGQDFEEPAGARYVLKNTFVVEDGKLVINCVTHDGTKLSRIMEPTANGLVHIFYHEKIPIVCKRYMTKI